MTEQAYMREPWFDLLSQACKRESRHAVALRLGLSDSVISQVMNGSGLYGSGKASTSKVADRVTHKFGSFECPHLSQHHGEVRMISATECRNYAHRSAPTNSPQALTHWRACNACPHKPLSAPAPPREVRKRRKGLSITTRAEAGAQAQGVSDE